MTSEASETATTKTYQLTCTDCAFEATVEGNFNDALDVAETHQEEHGEPPMQHFVNFELDGKE